MGTIVRSYGITPATSNGTSITPGTVSDGTWAQLSAGISDACWFWQVVLSYDGTAAIAETYHVDFGIGASSSVLRTPIIDLCFLLTASETMSSKMPGVFAQGVIGDQLFARAQAGNSGVSNFSAAAYGVGGVA